MDRSPVIALMLYLAAVGSGVLLLGGIFLARRAARPGLARLLTWLLVGGMTGYLGLLLGVSLTSHEITLPPGDRKSLCGFYLDCHVGFAVKGVHTEESGSDRLYLVDLEIQSDARRITMTPGPLDVALLDEGGRLYRRDPVAEARATGRPWRDNPFDESLPAGQAYIRTIAFRLPADARNPRLLVREGFWLDRLIETVLIGDDDSWLHPRTLMALGAA
jgi:hypothetical protein